jgi:Hypoxia induced protein conserved region
MTVFLIILIGGSMIAAAVALFRGLQASLQESDHIRRDYGVRIEAFGVKQNRMMAQRVLCQGIAILLIAMIGALASSK